MNDMRFDVYFSGQLVQGRDREQVMQSIGKLFNASGPALEQLFSGRPVRIKQAVDQDTAVAYRVRFRDAGALVEIRPVRQQNQDPQTDGRTAAESNSAMNLLPPRTGSLIDCAAKVVPADIPDISDMSLSDAGAILDNTPPPAPAVIDTGEMGLAPPRSGSLEDCQPPPAPTPLPDISALRLEQPEEDR